VIICCLSTNKITLCGDYASLFYYHREFFRIEGPAYDGAGGPVFNADGRSYAYAAKKANSYCVVADGLEGPSYDALIAGRGGRVVFDSVSRMRYLALKGNAVFVVEGKTGK
jgi:hypothetical protein